jgi:pimeloyl-ACP methyl ester carboxylesterase
VAAHKSVELPNGVKLSYGEQGDASGVPVLFLHGLADSWHAFEPVLAHLPDSIRAFAITQRGHGDSSHPAQGYHISDIVADLREFMGALELDAAVIVGASSGGFAARQFAIEHADSTLALVLWGSPATLRNKPEIIKWRDTVLATMTDPVDASFVRDFQVSTLVRPVPPEFFERLIEESMKVPAHAWRATVAGLLEDDSLAQLGKIKAPTLILWGDADTILSRSDQEMLVEAIPGARLLIYPGAGHTLYWEEPMRVAADLAAFIQEIGN